MGNMTTQYSVIKQKYNIFYRELVPLKFIDANEYFSVFYIIRVPLRKDLICQDMRRLYIKLLQLLTSWNTEKANI